MQRSPPVRGPGVTGPAAASLALHAVVLGAVAGLIGWFGGGEEAKRAMVIAVGPPQLPATAQAWEPEPLPALSPVEAAEPQVQPVAEEFPVAEFEALVVADAPPAWLQAPPRERREEGEAERREEEAEQRGKDSQPLRPPEAARASPPAITQDTCAAPAYPRLAQRRGVEGTVWLRLRVTPEGLPAEVILEISSGHSLLDESALAAARGWKLIPATRDGVPVEGVLRVPVTFRLESGR